jgi:hypothetical protein
MPAVQSTEKLFNRKGAAMAQFIRLLICCVLLASTSHADDLAFIPKVDVEVLRAAHVQQIHISYRFAYARATKLQNDAAVVADEFCIGAARETACRLSFRALRDLASRLATKTELLYVEIEMIRTGALGAEFDRLRAEVEKEQLQLDADFAYLITEYKDLAMAEQ